MPGALPTVQPRGPPARLTPPLAQQQQQQQRGPPAQQQYQQQQYQQQQQYGQQPQYGHQQNPYANQQQGMVNPYTNQQGGNGQGYGDEDYYYEEEDDGSGAHGDGAYLDDQMRALNVGGDSSGGGAYDASGAQYYHQQQAQYGGGGRGGGVSRSASSGASLGGGTSHLTPSSREYVPNHLRQSMSAGNINQQQAYYPADARGWGAGANAAGLYDGSLDGQPQGGSWDGGDGQWGQQQQQLGAGQQQYYVVQGGDAGGRVSIYPPANGGNPNVYANAAGQQQQLLTVVDQNGRTHTIVQQGGMQAQYGVPSGRGLTPPPGGGKSMQRGSPPPADQAAYMQQPQMYQTQGIGQQLVTSADGRTFALVNGALVPVITQGGQAPNGGGVVGLAGYGGGLVDSRGMQIGGMQMLQTQNGTVILQQPAGGMGAQVLQVVQGPGGTTSLSAMPVVLQGAGGAVGQLVLSGPGGGNIILSNSGAASVGSTGSALLDEFKREGKGRSSEWRVHNVSGHILAFCKDQQGSRFIQLRLEATPNADGTGSGGDSAGSLISEKQLVLDEILPHAAVLCNDVFGNYVIQKMFEHGTPAMRSRLGQVVTEGGVHLSTAMYGCRVVQKALQFLDDKGLVKLMSKFEGEVERLIHDQNGNHVIQKCIEVVCSKAVARNDEGLTKLIDFIVNAVLLNLSGLACHGYGCRVVQRMLEHCVGRQKQKALEVIHRDMPTLVDDQFGNYVIQHVLQYGRQEDKNSILQLVLQRGVLHVSKQKFASNVVEKILVFGDGNQKATLVSEMLKNTPQGESVLLCMVRDAFANYVVQKALEVAEVRQRGALVEVLRGHLSELRQFTYAKHIITKIEKE